MSLSGFLKQELLEARRGVLFISKLYAWHIECPEYAGKAFICKGVLQKETETAELFLSGGGQCESVLPLIKRS